MALKRRQSEEDDAGGAAEWMVTFSDCMTLLLTFFVLLISFSSFDEKVFQRMESALAEGLGSVSISLKRQRDALQTRQEIVYEQELDRGSETPTKDGKYASNPSENLDFMNFRNQKIFLVRSEKIFWGRGTLVSLHGRRLFADIATLIEALPNRVVVSEYDLGAGEAPADIGLERAWQIARFLTKRHGLDQTRFSISSAGTVPVSTIRASELFASATPTDRVVEIAILDRSTYR